MERNVDGDMCLDRGRGWDIATILLNGDNYWAVAGCASSLNAPGEPDRLLLECG